MICRFGFYMVEYKITGKAFRFPLLYHKYIK